MLIKDKHSASDLLPHAICISESKITLIFVFAGHDIVLDVGVLCNSEDITLTLTVTTDFFNGMIYPKGLSKNSTCMTEYIQQEASIIMQGTGLEVGSGDTVSSQGGDVSCQTGGGVTDTATFTQSPPRQSQLISIEIRTRVTMQ